MDETYDVVVVGGGAAGLSGALALGRARRSVLVVDGGEPRNAPAGHVHNYLGREGTPPGELLAIGREEVGRYGVEVRTGAVVAATRAAPPDPAHAGHGGHLALPPGFEVRLADGTTVRARRLLVTTGGVDDLPDLPGIAAGWGDTVVHCPYCHGWEIRDRAVGVLGTGPAAMHQTLLFRQWTADLTLFTHTGVVLTAEEREQLAARHVTVVEGEVAGWEAGGVRMRSGELVPRQALVVGAAVHARAGFLSTLGLEAVPTMGGEHVIGSHLPTDATGQTAVPGVWAAGNVTDPMAQVIASAAAGLMAGAVLNMDLVTEDTRQAVEVARFFGAAAWEERYAAGTIRWSGNPNAVLVAEAADLPAGRVLDVGAGEGADAVWLAGRGWQVTGVDISSVALGRAAAHAEERGLKVDWVHADLLADPPAAAAFDLVTAHFMHLPSVDRQALYGRLADAVAPGGTLLLVGHDPADHGRPDLPDMFFTADQLVADLDPDRWEVLVAEVRPRPGRGPDGTETTLRDVVLRARKRP